MRKQNTTNQIRINESGYKIKECPQCKQDININSFTNDICNICVEDNIVKVWLFTDGDYNDIYNRTVLKGNANQIEEYVKSQFDQFDNKDDIVDLGSDGIGLVIYREDGLSDYYAEATIIENYNINEDGDINIDLTEDNNQVSTDQ